MGGTGSTRSKRAWQQVYRALNHGLAKEACRNQKIIEKFPIDIQNFANTFATMQTKRHSADYDPSEIFYKSQVNTDVAGAKDVIERFGKIPAKDRRAFAALVLFKYRP